ncbi:MAG: 9-O-acetylesterase [Armatimonadota bacterium]|nr:MAG: 9-O-acetylesterase [Armatimonadota bacterium]
MRLRSVWMCIAGCWLLLAASAFADVRLARIFSDHAVLQRGKPVPVWGTAEPGEKVTVEFRGQKVSTTANDNGEWRVTLKPMPAGGPFQMTVRGHNTIVLQDVLVGEVWVCSGQSNMEWPVALSNNAEQEIAQANHPQIRLFMVPKAVADRPLKDLSGGAWQPCTPETVRNFSAVGYFFARELQKTLKVPVGMIQTAWGGTPAESWTSKPTLMANSSLRYLLENWRRAEMDYPQAQENYRKQLAEWEKVAAQARAEGKPEPKKPDPPQDPRTNPWKPSGLFNAMIAPIVPYAIQGAIWYQGESNAGRAYEYRTLFPAMIQDWREAWAQGDFPFLFVQLANFMAAKPEPGESAWAELREAQLMTLSLPKTGMAVAIDIGDANDIHPRNKQDVGKRLALNALAIAYGKKVVYSGPVYERMKREGNAIRLYFKHVDGGLMTPNGEPLKGFAIAGADRKFVWAEARIEGNTVVVQSPQVPEPVAVRYAWADNPVCNLYNRAGLPASPFRTDDWPGVTQQGRR